MLQRQDALQILSELPMMPCAIFWLKTPKETNLVL